MSDYNYNNYSNSPDPQAMLPIFYCSRRKILSQDQERLSKMTSMLSEKTRLLEAQDLKVSLLRKRLEAEQKAKLNNRLVIKKLHEKVSL